MKRTRTLFGILMLLISCMLLYYVITNQDKTTTFITKIINKYTKKRIVVPKESYNHRTYLFSTVSETDNFDPKNINDLKKIYYTVLNNGWDSFTFYCNEEYINCVDDIKTITNGNKDDFINIINNYVSPYNSYRKYNTTVVNDNEITLSVEKLYSNEEIANIETIINNVISKNKININNATSLDIEKAHDYIINTVSYDEDYNKNDKTAISNKANGALINKKALCSGYTDAFALFLDKLNIPNFKVASDEHVWNVVYFNKKWLHIDVTWDDDEVNKNNNRNFYMISTKDLLTKDKKEHNYNKNLYLELK